MPESFLSLRTNSNTPTCLKDNAPLTQISQCITSSRHDLTEEVSYKFTFCSFVQLSEENLNGGAISCIGSSIYTSTSLIVSSCSFSECGANNGGAIYTSTLSIFDLQNSVFYKCSSTSEIYNEGGGSLLVSDIQQQLSLFGNDFISSTCTASGGGLQLRGCSLSIYGSTIINSCRFVDCNATINSPDGGALCIWNNRALIGMTACVFSFCHSDDDGGAIRHDINGYEPKSYPIRFCFFNGNSVSNGGTGNDILLNVLPSDDPLLQCCSTSHSKRVGYISDTHWFTDDFNWLPYGCN